MSATIQRIDPYGDREPIGAAFERCDGFATLMSPNGMRRCVRCLDRYGREGFEYVDEPGRCDEPDWGSPSWQNWLRNVRPGWATPERLNAPRIHAQAWERP